MRRQLFNLTGAVCALLFLLAGGARAATTTVSSFALEDYAYTTATLKITVDSQFVDSAGQMRQPPPSFVKVVTCSVASRVVTCPSFTLATTSDARVNRLALYTGSIWDGSVRRATVWENYSLPASLGTPLVLADWHSWANAGQPALPSTWIDTVLGFINSAINVGNPATTTTLGRVKMSTAPVDPVSPVAVGKNDTATTSNAGVVTFAASGESSATKAVRADDSRLTALGWFNVKTYGAVGDGTTDDLSAFNSAIAACNSAGGGIVYAPRPTNYYKLTAATTTITAPCTIRGDGSGSSPSAVAWTTKIVQTSRTANLFTFNSDSGSVEHVYLFNSNSTYGVSGAAPATPPTAGAGIAVVATSSSTRVNLFDVVVEGFYRNVAQDGAHWSIVSSHLVNPVNYSLLVTNTVNADAGDWSVVGSWFTSKTYMAAAAVRITSGAGGKFLGNKFNTYDDPAIPGATGFTDHVSVNITPSNIGILVFIGNSLENASRWSIDVTSSLEVVVVGNQFGHYLTGSQAAIQLIGTADSVIEGNVFRGSVVSGWPAVSLANCSKCMVGDSNVNSGFGALHLTAGTYSTGGPNYANATLTNSWTNVGTGLATAGYALHGGVVYVRGTVTGGSPATASFLTLPAGMRPALDEIRPGTNNAAYQRIRVNADGTIVPEGLGSSAGAISFNFSFIPAP